MDIKLLNIEEQIKYYDEIYNMLVEGDEEFVPPLSSRSSSVQSGFSNSVKAEDGIKSYFEEMKKQCFMIAEENGVLLAFVSYRENYFNDVISEAELPDIYISTLMVKPEGRGKGLTKKMYATLFEHYANANIFTRTWSTNTAHIKILSGFGFEILHTVKDHRGKGIDTVYFVKKQNGGEK